MEDDIEVTFEAVREDFLAYAEHAATTGEFYTSQMKRARVFVTLVLPVAGAATMLASDDRVFTTIMLVVVAIAVPVTWLTWPKQWRRQVKKQIERQLTMENPLVISGPRRFIISPEAVRFSTPHSGGYTGWPVIMRVSSDERSGYLHLSQGQAYVIPRRAFSTPGEFDRFLAAAESYRSAAKGT